MKKKILSVLMVTFLMTATLLMACGGDKDAKTPASTTKTESSAPAENNDAKDETPAPADNADTADTAGDMADDELFAALQESYAAMTEYYNAVSDLYSMDEIAADAEIEEIMNQAADVITQMGEITQDTITNDDAMALNDAIGDIIDVLSIVVEGMETVDGADAEMMSDETFAALQENYALLTEIYNTVVEMYSSDEVEANAEVEELLNEAAAIIEEMGTISQDEMTEADAEGMVEAMIAILDGLEAIAGAIG